LKGISTGSVDVLRVLLQAGALVNHQDMNGQTALWQGIIDSFFKN
jgi:hypothetical protein